MSAELQDANNPEDFFDMSIEELMEVPVVVSASRKSQKTSELSVPVSVITSEDIHYSGLTTIPEILRFACGVDVSRFDRSRYAVGVRGLHSRISDRTLVLINGRFANDSRYTGKFTKELTFSMNSYYQRIEHIVGVSNVTVGPVTNSTFANVDGATAYGAECEIALQNRKGKLSTWYAYNGLTTDQYGEGMRALWPAKHKAGVTGRLFLPDEWTFNTNYVFNDDVLGYGVTPIDAEAFHRLDLTVARQIARGKGEFMLGISDVLNKTNKVTLDIGEFTGHETPGRTFFARLQLRF